MDLRAFQTRQGKAQSAGNSGFYFQGLQHRLGGFGALPAGKARSGHLLCYASLKEGELFLRLRALQLAASRLAETINTSVTEY